ncbi:MAG: glutaredoxin domain-containing protein [Pseudomonadales bacterium]
MLRYLAPDAAPPADAVIFTRRGCSHCARAKALLREAGIDYDELVLNRDFTDRTLRALSQDATYPRVFVNGEQIGGADALAAWLAQHTA